MKEGNNKKDLIKKQQQKVKIKVHHLRNHSGKLELFYF